MTIKKYVMLMKPEPSKKNCLNKSAKFKYWLSNKF